MGTRIANKRRASVNEYTNVTDIGNGKVSIRFESQKFVIFQSTIVSSVRLEKGSDFLIDAKSVDYVNNNGESWSNESLLNNYKSFIGANACVDHPENPDQDNVGVILDAVLRKKWLCKEEGEFIYYVDILVAIDKAARNGQLAKKVLDGSIQYMSMGCDVVYSFCSRCGHAVDYTTNSMFSSCEHLKFSKNKKYLDTRGVERITAELLGKEKGSVVFVEASLLTSPPAFAGAILSRILPIRDVAKSIEIEMPVEALDKAPVKKYLLKK